MHFRTAVISPDTFWECKWKQIRSDWHQLVLPLLALKGTPQTATNQKLTRNSPGDEIANVNYFYQEIFNHFYAVRIGSYRIQRSNSKLAGAMCSMPQSLACAHCSSAVQ